MKKMLRFQDLKARGILSNRMTLKRWIDHHGFPCGRMIGPNSRAWTEEEVDAWLAERPSGRKVVAANKSAKSASTEEEEEEEEIWPLPKAQGPPPREAGSDPCEHLGRQLDHRSIKLHALRHAEPLVVILSSAAPDARADRQNREAP